MWKKITLAGAGALVALVVTAGCSSSDSGSEHPAEHSTSVSATASPTAPAAAEAHNDADVMFAQQMIPHHTQAIEMSDTLLAKQGIDPRVTELANQIKAAQGPEIQQMQGWMTQWGTPSMPPMSGHGDMPGMSGIMSEQDMTALKDAQGVDAGKLFLTQMITHHKGAITMAQSEIKDGQYPPAVEMARAIVTTQQQEIDTMNGILGSL
ncbi:MAG: hypothetical protein QOF47_797 [Mycobacterium sp.]|nr:hypothetical protein [Mycobacterium sp.]